MIKWRHTNNHDYMKTNKQTCLGTCRQNKETYVKIIERQSKVS
jgi:hypothetical protein